MSKKDFSVALKYVEARPRSQRRKGTEARVSGISVVGSGASATDLSLLQANLISVTNNFTALKDLFDSMFEKDSENNIHAKLSLWSSGGITAGGAGSGGGGGTSYNRLDSWANYGSDKSGWVLSALLGKDLDDRVSALANAGYITQSALAPYALRSEIPSLEGYATLDALNTLSQTVVNFKSLFDSMFEKDSDGNIHAKLSLWSSGGITAGGVGSGGSGGGGGISYSRLDSWSDYSADKAGYVLSALLGKDLDNRVSTLANAGYITQSALAPYALRSEIPSLVGYATQSWVESKNYLTGITSAMVTTALGYTPYNSANFTKANIKTTLGISDWALASAKPTYTASEVGALGVNGTAQSALKMTPEYLTDLNNATPWRFFDMNTGSGSTDGNKPNIAWVSGITGTVAGSRYFRWQLAMTKGSQNPYFRQEHSGYWNNWSTLAFTSDIPTRLSQLTDDVVAGKYLSLSGGTVNGDLKVSGVATLNSLTIGGVTLTYDSVNEALCINGNMYALGGITAGGVGSGGSGGGGASYDRLDAWADYSADKSGWVLSALLGNDLNTRLISVENAGYITQSALAPYALRSEIPSLVGYATESFVTSQGYITQSALGGYATQSWVESKNYLTGITSAMVTTALGYTPYNSANFTKDNLKSTLGISDWALASAAPTIKKERLTNFDSATPWTAFYTQFRALNRPDGANYFSGFTLSNIDFQGEDNTYLIQLALSHTGTLHTRYRVKGLFNAWRTLAFTSDIPTKLSQLTDDVVAGKYLPLRGGTLSGSNRDLLSLNTSNTSGPRINLYENGNLIALIGCVPKQTTTDYGAYFVNVSSKFGVILGNDKKAYITLNTDTMSKDYLILHSGNYSDYALSKYGGTVKGSITAPSFIGNLTGNADSATKLATPRTIWGQSFDGTQDVTGALTAPAITTNSLAIGGATITYDSVNEALCINGNMYALGGITAGGAGISAYSSLETRVARLEQQLNIS